VVSFGGGNGGNGRTIGKIVEDRGCLGIGGRRLYGIKFEFYPGEERYTEVPEIYLTAEMANSKVK
jgi:hypothetical protein